MRRTVMGIDPGVSGGICVLDDAGVVLFLEPIRNTFTYAEVVELIRGAWSFMEYGNTCYLEKVGYIGKRKGKNGEEQGDGGKGAFTFGKITGILAGAAIALGAKVVEPTPQLWQGKMECLTGGNKNVSKNRAKVLFPNIKTTHATADALLIAEYGRRRLYGERASLPPSL